VDRLHANARVLREELAVSGFHVEPGTMPIIPSLVGDPRSAMTLCEEVLRRGVFAQAIRPPTVPEGRRACVLSRWPATRSATCATPREPSPPRHASSGSTPSRRRLDARALSDRSAARRPAEPAPRRALLMTKARLVGGDPRGSPLPVRYLNFSFEASNVEISLTMRPRLMM
jgi:hypothetical protein